MTMFDELLDLLELVASRECFRADWSQGGRGTCADSDACEPCTASRLYARMVEAKARVSPQDDAVRTQ